MIQRRPRPELRPYVELVWSVGGGEGGAIAPGLRELSLPGGSHHLVIRADAPLRLFGSAEDRDGEAVGTAILGGMRLRAVRKAMDRAASVGAVLRPDALALVRHLSPEEVAGRHASLTDIWATREAHDRIARIQEDATAEARLAQFESLLVSLFQRAALPDPRLRRALLRLDQGARIETVVAEAGFSHRHFCARFRDAVGLLPVEYRQLRRFDRLVGALARTRRGDLAELALGAGYSDQAHMAREFRAFSGLSLSEYGRLAKTHPRHVSLPA